MLLALEMQSLKPWNLPLTIIGRLLKQPLSEAL